jgi:hypothetical protein
LRKGCEGPGIVRRGELRRGSSKSRGFGQVSTLRLMTIDVICLEERSICARQFNLHDTFPESSSSWLRSKVGSRNAFFHGLSSRCRATSRRSGESESRTNHRSCSWPIPIILTVVRRLRPIPHIEQFHILKFPKTLLQDPHILAPIVEPKSLGLIGKSIFDPVRVSNTIETVSSALGQHLS